jgi:hypothetical protein
MHNDECLILHVYASHVVYSNLQFCVNVVFKYDRGPSSLSSINLASFSYVFVLHWLVYKLCIELYFSCTIRVIDLEIDIMF